MSGTPHGGDLPERIPPATRSITPQWLPRLNRSVTNRLQGAWAPYLPPWAVVVHTGRNSGRTYRTPVLAFKHDGGFAIALPYGSRADWVRNVFAAGGCHLQRLGTTTAVAAPRIVTDPAGESLPRPLRAVARRVGVLVMAPAASAGPDRPR